MEQTKGKCAACGAVVDRGPIYDHLKACFPGGRIHRKKVVRDFHVLVEAPGLEDYWLHLAVPTDLDLSSLDYFLRDIWVECCEHLSEFRIQGRSYLSEGAGQDPWSGKRTYTMSQRLKDILRVGMAFDYDYDFGSTTSLRLRVLRGLDTSTNKIRILGRNEPPKFRCEICGERDAEVVCGTCGEGGGGWFCRECAEGDEHACGNEMLLPLVNSPRVGVCGYSG